MWPFARKPDKAALQGYKSVVINGHRFVIRKINPIVDFKDDEMPQIFSAYMSRRKKAEVDKQDNQASNVRALNDIRSMVKAGLVEPALVPELTGDQAGKEEGITIRDIVRDEDTAAKLYVEILLHSLNRFRGIKGIFFSARNRRVLSMPLQSDTDSVPAISPSQQGNSA